MKVTVRFYAHLRDLVDKKNIVELDLKEGATISQLMEELLRDSQIKEALLDRNKKLKPEITILKSGREIKFLAGMETELGQGDEISFFPSVAGG